MNGIVIEIKLEEKVMGLPQVHEDRDKGHIYGLDMVRTEIQAIQAIQDHLHLYYIYLLVLKLWLALLQMYLTQIRRLI